MAHDTVRHEEITHHGYIKLTLILCEGADIMSMKALILCNDSFGKEFLAEIFEGHTLQFVDDLHLIASPSVIIQMVTDGVFDSLVISNLGIPLSMAKAVLHTVPLSRQYKATMISGVINNDLRDLCAGREIGLQAIPATPRELTTALL